MMKQKRSYSLILTSIIFIVIQHIVWSLTNKNATDLQTYTNNLIYDTPIFQKCSQNEQNKTGCVEVEQFLCRLGYRANVHTQHHITNKNSPSFSVQTLQHEDHYMLRPQYILAEAIMNRDLDLTIQLVKKLMNGQTFSHLASALEGSFSIQFLQLFQSVGIDFLTTMRGGYTCLHIAVKHRNLMTVEWLLNNTSINIHQQAGELTEHVLFTSVRYFQKQIFHLLLRYGANPLTPNSEGATPLHVAIKENYRAAIQHLLYYDVAHDAIDVFGKSILSYAMEQHNFELVQLLVCHPTFSKRLNNLSKRTVNNNIASIPKLIGKVPPSILIRLLKVETNRNRIEICATRERGQSLLWQTLHEMLVIPFNHRDKQTLQIYSQLIHIILNYYTFVRVTRSPGYKMCNPHTTGYIGHMASPKTPYNARIPLEFLLDPQHPLHFDIELISRLYLAIDPANEISLLARLARHHDNLWSFERVITQKPETISTKIFLLGRSNYLDGCVVAARRQLWPAVRACIELLRTCLTYEPYNSLGLETLIKLQWRIKETSLHNYQELYSICLNSYKWMIFHAARVENSAIFSNLASGDLATLTYILSNVPIKNNLQAGRNLFFLKGLITLNKKFDAEPGMLTPIENAVSSYLADTAATKGLSDTRYLESVFSHPYSWFSRKNDMQKAIEYLGVSVVYGFTRPSEETVHFKNTLLQMAPSFSCIFTFLRHPPVHHGVFSHFPNDTIRNPQSALSQPAVILAHGLSDLPYADRGTTRWKLGLLRVSPSNLYIDARHETGRPSNDILLALAERRKQMIKLIVTSPSVEYDPVFKKISVQILKICCIAFGVRIVIYIMRATVVALPICGHTLGEYIASGTVDFWEMIYPAYSGIEAVKFALSCAFLGRLGTRHHPWDFCSTCIQILETAFSVSGVCYLYIWAFWTNDFHYIYNIVTLQITVFIFSLLSTTLMTKKGTFLLIANFCPCSMYDLEKAVYISRTDLLDWHYRHSAGLSNENEFHAVVSEEVRYMRQSRSQGRQNKIIGTDKWIKSQHPYTWRSKQERYLDDDIYKDFHHIWDTTNDENLGDIFQVCNELAGKSFCFLPGGKSQQLLKPHHYLQWSREGQYRYFRLRHEKKSNLNLISNSLNSMSPPYNTTPLLKKKKKKLIQRINQTMGHDGPNDQLNVEESLSPHKKDKTTRRVRFDIDTDNVFNEIPISSEDAARGEAKYRIIGNSSYLDGLPRVENWERCGITPPAFLDDYDHNKYLGPVRCPQGIEFERIRQELEQSKYHPVIERFLHPADLLRINRQRQHLFDCGPIDLGHLPTHELRDRVTKLNTIDFIALFHHTPQLRRFACRVFFAGMGKYTDYVLIVCLLEMIAFSCSIIPSLIRILAPQRFGIATADFFLGASRLYVSYRLCVEVIRPVALHIMLSRQAEHIGQMFTWKEIQPYLALKTVEMMRGIWNIRRVASRRLDNMVELTRHQFNTVVFGLFVLYLPFIYTLHSVTDKFFHFGILLQVYLLILTLTGSTMLTTYFGYRGYQSMLQFVKLGHWIHRVVDPVRSCYHPLVFLADKNNVDPTLHSRCFAIAGFRFTSNVVIFVFLLVGLISMLLGFLFYNATFPHIQQSWGYDTAFI